MDTAPKWFVHKPSAVSAAILSLDGQSKNEEPSFPVVDNIYQHTKDNT